VTRTPTMFFFSSAVQVTRTVAHKSPDTVVCPRSYGTLRQRSAASLPRLQLRPMKSRDGLGPLCPLKTERHALSTGVCARSRALVADRARERCNTRRAGRPLIARTAFSPAKHFAAEPLQVVRHLACKAPSATNALERGRCRQRRRHLVQSALRAHKSW